MKDVSKVYMYAGQLIDDMTREELIYALKDVGELYQQTLEHNIQTHHFYNQLRSRK